MRIETHGARPARVCPPRDWAVNNRSASEIARATDKTTPIGLQTPRYAQLKYGLTRDNTGAFELLTRHTSEEIREVADAFWFDRDVVSPDASWGATTEDDPATYSVVDRNN